LEEKGDWEAAGVTGGYLGEQGEGEGGTDRCPGRFTRIAFWVIRRTNRTGSLGLVRLQREMMPAGVKFDGVSPRVGGRRGTTGKGGPEVLKGALNFLKIFERNYMSQHGSNPPADQRGVGRASRKTGEQVVRWSDYTLDVCDQKGGGSGGGRGRKGLKTLHVFKTTV